MTIRTAVTAICCVSLLSGCAAKGSTGTAHPDRNVITHQQMVDNHFQNGYEAVQALHPNWLQPRGPDSFSSTARVEVYQEATHLGGVETLRNVLLSNIVYMRWYDGVAAQQRFGVGHNNGVIYVASHADSSN
jgi:hypothetical protein